MDAGDFSIWKWLAELLGPGGFVAFVAAGGEGWFIYKLMGWHNKERTALLAAHAAALVLKDAEHQKERDEYHHQCQAERKEWREFMESAQKQTGERFRQLRSDGKEAWAIVNGLKMVVSRMAGRKVRGRG